MNDALHRVVFVSAQGAEEDPLFFMGKAPFTFQEGSAAVDSGHNGLRDVIGIGGNDINQFSPIPAVNDGIHDLRADKNGDDCVKTGFYASENEDGGQNDNSIRQERHPSQREVKQG